MKLIKYKPNYQMRLIWTCLCMLSITSTYLSAYAQYKVETVAGGGGATENVLATTTSLYRPTGVAVDASGNIYLTDEQNHRIRKMDASTGNISTIAGTGEAGFSGDGGAATLAQLRFPRGLEVDASGNVFFCDLSNNRVRKIDGSTGIISTIAGTGTRGFSGDGGAANSAEIGVLGGITVDGSGNIYIAERTNNRIRKIDGSTGIISTIAGTGTAGFSGDGAAATSAQLNGPVDVVVDASGNVYIAEANNHSIRKIDAITGNISTIVGTGTSGFSGDGGAATSAQIASPRGLEVDAAGNVYIADHVNHRIRKIDSNTGNISTIAGTGVQGFSGDGGLATSAQSDWPYKVVIDPSGDLIIAEFGNNRIRKIVTGTGIISTIIGNGYQGNGVGFSGDGSAATSAVLGAPNGVAVDNSGNIYIADRANHRIRKIDSNTGNISTIAGTGVAGYSGDGGVATSAQLNLPLGIAVDNAGNVYIADETNHRFRKIDANTGIISTIAGTGVAGYSGDGGAATSAQFNFPTGIALDGSGNILLVDFASHRIRKIDVNTGIVTTIAGTGVAGFSGDGGAATSAQINDPYGIAVDGSDNVYITERGNHLIRKIDGSTGLISTIAGTRVAGFSGDGGVATLAQLNRPFGVAVDASENVYVIDFNNFRTRKIDKGTGIISTIAGTGLSGYSGDGGLATSAQFSISTSLTTDGSGNVFVADRLNGRIRKLTPLPNIALKVNTNTVASGGSQAFDSTTYNIASKMTFTIENTGPGTLDISELSASGDFSIESGVPLTSVAAGASADITIAMNVSSAGDKTGMFTIKSNDINDATYTISLTGTVSKADQSITFDLGANANKEVGDPTFDLSATTTATGLTITYASSDANVATISGNTVTILGAGTTTITASQAGDNNYNAAGEVTQTLTVAGSSITGLPSNLVNGRMTLFPNPVGDLLKLNFSGNIGFGAGSTVKIQVYTLQGQLLQMSQGNLDQSGGFILNTSALAVGMYHLVVTLPNGAKIQRRIVKK